MPDSSFSSKKILGFAIIVFLLTALSIRFYKLGTMYNYIDDLSARHAILAMDIARGIIHFPHGPFLFEFDETGFAFIVTPWLLVFGFNWLNFQAFSAFTGTLLVGIVAYFTSRFFNRISGLTALAIAGSLPAFLIWDRFFFMSGSAIVSVLDLITLCILMSPEKQLSTKRLIISGSILGLSTYTASLTSLVIPSAFLIIVIQLRNKTSLSLKTFLRNTIPWISAYIGVILPLYISLFREPYYILWRTRHFLPFKDNPTQALKGIGENLISIFKDLFVKAEFFLHQPPGEPILPLPILLLFSSGILAVVLKPRIRKRAWPILLYIATWYSMMLLLKPESWRGVYVSNVLPFIIAVCGIGGSFLASLLFKSEKKQLLLMSGFLFVLMIWQISLFLAGPYKIPWRDDILTRLQLDLSNDPDIPHIFSARIPDVYHYHYPFWLVTRSRLSRVSIFDWNDDGCISHPDKQSVVFRKAVGQQIIFVIRQEDEEEFRRYMKNFDVKKTGIYRRTGLLKITCNIEVDELLKRTWTSSAVPPIIKLDPQARQNTASKNE